MRLFVYEFVTGGGMAGEALPPTLVREADLMLQALIAELATLPIELLTCRDPRLPPIDGVPTLVPAPGEDRFACFGRGVAASDAAWPTAPETGGILERLARMTLAAGRRLVGCRPEAIAVAASKVRTAAALAARGLPVVPTFTQPADLPALPGPWVVKPDDGAGAVDTRWLADRDAARRHLAAHPGSVAQPWLAGDALSLSLNCQESGVELLAVNRQHLSLDGGHVRLRALEVNILPDPARSFGAFAERIVAGIPGLSGYVGVDLVATAAGPVVLEVNPRLTTSYVGLARVLPRNLAAAVLGLDPGEAPAATAAGPLTLDLETLDAG